MAEVDTRIETVEEEIKVLKGEIRRTLVDLRALLMREDSPLNERTIGCMASPADAEIGAEPTITRREVSEMLSHGSAETARPATLDTQPQNPPSEPNPSQQLPQGPGMAAAGPAYMGMPPMQNPMWGAGNMPAPPSTPAAAPLPPDPAIAERERRLAEQEHRMEAQERRLADQEHKIASATRKEDSRAQDDVERPTAEERAPPPDSAMAERERSLAEQERRMKEQEGRLADQECELASAKLRENAREHDDIEWPVVAVQEQRPQSLAASQGDREGQHTIEEWDNPPEEREQTAPLYDRRERPNEVVVDTVVSRSPSTPGAGRLVPEMEDGHWDGEQDEVLQAAPPKSISRGDHSKDDDEPPKAVNSNGSCSRVYDEYSDLLSETEEIDAPDQVSSVELPLDINLLSSITHWTALTKNRVGEQRLNEILDLYSQSGHLPEKLRELLEQISGTLDGAELETSQDAQGWVDQIFHLHGILTGGLTIRQLVKSSSGI